MTEERQNESIEIITFEQLYRDCTLKALNRAGSAVGAARLLGVSARTVFRWIKDFDIIRDPLEAKYIIRKTTQHEKSARNQSSESQVLA